MDFSDLKFLYNNLFSKDSCDDCSLDKHQTLEGDPTNPEKDPGDPEGFEESDGSHKEIGGYPGLVTQRGHGKRSRAGSGSKQTLMILLRRAAQIYGANVSNWDELKQLKDDQIWDKAAEIFGGKENVAEMIDSLPKRSGGENIDINDVPEELISRYYTGPRNPPSKINDGKGGARTHARYKNKEQEAQAFGAKTKDKNAIDSKKNKNLKLEFKELDSESTEALKPFVSSLGGTHTKGRRVFAAYHNGKMVGRLDLNHNPARPERVRPKTRRWPEKVYPATSESYSINMIEVLPEYRRKGIATDLLQRARKVVNAPIHNTGNTTREGGLWQSGLRSRGLELKPWLNTQRQNAKSPNEQPTSTENQRGSGRSAGSNGSEELPGTVQFLIPEDREGILQSILSNYVDGDEINDLSESLKNEIIDLYASNFFSGNKISISREAAEKLKEVFEYSKESRDSEGKKVIQSILTKIKNALKPKKTPTNKPKLDANTASFMLPRHIGDFGSEAFYNILSTISENIDDVYSDQVSQEIGQILRDKSFELNGGDEISMSREAARALIGQIDRSLENGEVYGDAAYDLEDIRGLIDKALKDSGSTQERRVRPEDRIPTEEERAKLREEMIREHGRHLAAVPGTGTPEAVQVPEHTPRDEVISRLSTLSPEEKIKLNNAEKKKNEHAVQNLTENLSIVQNNVLPDFEAILKIKKLNLENLKSREKEVRKQLQEAKKLRDFSSEENLSKLLDSLRNKRILEEQNFEDLNKYVNQISELVGVANNPNNAQVLSRILDANPRFVKNEHKKFQALLHNINNIDWDNLPDNSPIDPVNAADAAMRARMYEVQNYIDRINEKIKSGDLTKDNVDLARYIESLTSDSIRGLDLYEASPRVAGRVGPDPESGQGKPDWLAANLIRDFGTDISTSQDHNIFVIPNQGTPQTSSRTWKSVQELEKILDILFTYDTVPTLTQVRRDYKNKYGENLPNYVNIGRSYKDAAAEIDQYTGAITFHPGFFYNHAYDPDAGKYVPTTRVSNISRRNTFYHEVGHGLDHSMLTDKEFFDKVFASNFGKYYDFSTGYDEMISYIDIPGEHIADIYGIMLIGGDPLNKLLQNFPESVKLVFQGAKKYGYPMPAESAKKIVAFFKKNPNAKNAEFVDPREAIIPEANNPKNQLRVDSAFLELFRVHDALAGKSRWTSGTLTSENMQVSAEFEMLPILNQLENKKTQLLEELQGLTGLSNDDINRILGKAREHHSLYWGSNEPPDTVMRPANTEPKQTVDEFFDNENVPKDLANTWWHVSDSPNLELSATHEHEQNVANTDSGALYVGHDPHQWADILRRHGGYLHRLQFPDDKVEYVGGGQFVIDSKDLSEVKPLGTWPMKAAVDYKTNLPDDLPDEAYNALERPWEWEWLPQDQRRFLEEQQHALIDPNEQPANADSIKNLKIEQRPWGIAAVIGDKVIGDLFLTEPDKNGVRTIDDISVEEEWRRKGVATAMLEFARRSGPVRHAEDLTDEGRAWAEAVEQGQNEDSYSSETSIDTIKEADKVFRAKNRSFVKSAKDIIKRAWNKATIGKELPTKEDTFIHTRKMNDAKGAYQKYLNRDSELIQRKTPYQKANGEIEDIQNKIFSVDPLGNKVVRTPYGDMIKIPKDYNDRDYAEQLLFTAHDPTKTIDQKRENIREIIEQFGGSFKELIEAGLIDSGVNEDSAKSWFDGIQRDAAVSLSSLPADPTEAILERLYFGDIYNIVDQAKKGSRLKSQGEVIEENYELLMALPAADSIDDIVSFFDGLDDIKSNQTSLKEALAESLGLKNILNDALELENELNIDDVPKDEIKKYKKDLLKRAKKALSEKGFNEDLANDFVDIQLRINEYENNSSGDEYPDWLSDLFDEGQVDNNQEQADTLGPTESVPRLAQEDYQEVLNESRGKDLTELPTRAVNIKNIGNLFFGSNKNIQNIADNYNKRRGLGEHPQDYTKVDPNIAAKIAAEYDKMKHDPSDPQVKAAYDALKRETIDQYKAAIDAGYKFDFYPEGADPYPNSPREAILDLIVNKHMYVYPTVGEDGGFGQDAADYPNHPLLEFIPGLKWSGKPVTYNDVFRAIHDFYGHGKEGLGFRADGEDNAYRQHHSMFSPEAQKALASETRGQNSWVNFGPHGEHNRTATTDTIYAPQKAGLLPDWVIDPNIYVNNQSNAINNLTAEELKSLNTMLEEHQKYAESSPLAAARGEGRIDAYLAWKNRVLPSSTKLTDDLQSAVDSYTGFMHGFINSSLRSNKKSDSEITDLVSKIDKSIASQKNLTSSITVFRGISDIDSESLSMMAKKGSVFTDQGYTSASLNPGIAQTFAEQDVANNNRVQIEINIPEGSKLLTVDPTKGVDRLKNTYSEDEVLLPRGSTFKVTGVDVQDLNGIPYYHITADLVKNKNANKIGKRQDRIDAAFDITQAAPNACSINYLGHDSSANPCVSLLSDRLGKLGINSKIIGGIKPGSYTAEFLASDRFDFKKVSEDKNHAVKLSATLSGTNSWSKKSINDTDIRYRPDFVAVDNRIWGGMILRDQLPSGYSRNAEEAFGVRAGFENGTVYRGMSYEEMDQILTRGYIQSTGLLNAGPEDIMKDTTFFTEYPFEAASYVHGAANLVPTAEKPGFIVELKAPDDSSINKEAQLLNGNVPIKGKIPVSEIKRIVQVDLVGAKTRDISLVSEYGSTHLSGIQPTDMFVYRDVTLDLLDSKKINVTQLSAEDLKRKLEELITDANTVSTIENLTINDRKALEKLTPTQMVNAIRLLNTGITLKEAISRVKSK